MIRERINDETKQAMKSGDKARLSRQANVISEALRKCHTRHTSIAQAVTADRDAILTVLA